MAVQQWRYGAIAAPVALAAAFWCWLVTSTVPAPYLDEIFHIPQAQVYCKGAYSQWDDKITTPPGLYLLTLPWARLLDPSCSPWVLRAFNTLVITCLSCLVVACRARLDWGRHSYDSHVPGHGVSAYALHTGLNVALFPILFFFSGLYYTDVLSTCVVLGAFLNHLHRVKHSASPPSVANDFFTVLLGVFALFMRQTNVFWIVGFIGGLEAVAAVKSQRPKPTKPEPRFETLSSQFWHYAQMYWNGDIHDPTVNLAGPQDLPLTVVSLAIAALGHLPVILRRVYPHLVVLVLFCGFVFWNGGVVLGDKSNHVATIHVAQMLYLWPLVVFFSAPLLYPQARGILCFLIGRQHESPDGSVTQAPSPDPVGATHSDGMTRTQSIPIKRRTTPRSPPTSQDPSTNLQPSRNNQQQSLALTAFNTFFNGWFVSALFAGVCFVAALAIVHWNTIIHPFTLADNRHYMFYVFRYTVRKPVVRYALVPVYPVCGYLAWATLYGDRPTTPLPGKKVRWPTVVSPHTSTILVLLVTTAASLVTAPLVEPRYFILPWVFWRLLVPGGPWGKRDYRLILETLWFSLINVVTMYTFLTRPYIWRDEHGTILDDGKEQRFMW